MAEGFNLTTYYAKRIIGDTAAANAEKALLQTGDDITTDTWILHRTDRTNKLYGIKYKYDSNGHDKMEYYGQTSNDNATAWIQFDTGDASFNNIFGKVEVTNTTIPNTGTAYYFPYITGNATNTYGLLSSNRLYLYEASNTTYFCIGATDRTGGLTIRNANGKYADIVTSAFGANRILTLPNEDGTFALMTNTDINALINLLDTGTSVLTADDYIITQYVGGGTTTTTYHRRAAKNVRVGGLTTARSLWGNSFDGTADISGNITISGSTSNGMAAGSANPHITFIENGTTQPVHLIYTDLDSYRAPAGLKVVGGTSATPAWFEVEGEMYFGGNGIYHVGTAATQRIIRIIDSGDQYGTGVSIGAGGLALFGSGESTSTLISSLDLTAGGTETTYISSDGDIKFYASQNSYDASSVMTMTQNKLYIGVNSDTTREAGLYVQSGAGQLELYCAAGTSGNRGLWSPAHGTGASKNFILIDTNNNATFTGSLSGNATTATKATNLNCSRVTKSANEHPGKNITSMQEFSSTSANLPSSHFYYILEAQGDDPAYSVQLAMGETASAIYYRAIQNNTYNDWNRLVTNSGSWSISVTGSSGSCTGNAATATSTSKLTLISSNTASTSTNTYATNGLNVRWFSETRKLPGQPSQWGFLLTVGTGDSAAENHQIFIQQADGSLYHRGTNSSSYTNPPAFKILIDSSNWYKQIFANKNISRSTLTVSDSAWSVTSGTDVFGLAFKDTGLTYTPSGGSATASSDSGDWRMWLTCAAASNTVQLNMRIDGSFQSEVLYSSYIDVSGAAQPTAGKLAGLTSAHSRLYGNALYISNPSTTNDQGWIRVLGTGETDTVLEIATGDDGGAGEQIVCRQYNTSNVVARQATLLDTSGNTSFPGQVSCVGRSTTDTTTANYYHTGGLQIYESNLVGNTQDNFAYAPRIGFHWRNRIAATLSFHKDGIFYFRKQNGTDRATIDAIISRAGVSKSWYQGRDSAIIKTTSYSGYDAILSMKTTAGDWALGVYNDNIMYFTYILDSNYNANSNTVTKQFIFNPNGTLTATTFSGALSGNATTSSGVLDCGNTSKTTTFAYSKAGLAYADYTWLAAWNGYELRAVNKSQFAQASHSHSYLPLAGGTMTGAINFDSKGACSIYNGANDNTYGVGGALNNLVISSWYGISFTTSCTGQTYTNTNAVSINCRNGNMYAARFNGPLTGNVTGNCSGSSGSCTGNSNTANYQNCVQTNEIRYARNGNMASANDLWQGWAFAEGKVAVINGWRFGNGNGALAPIYGSKVYNAIWNDFAEYRESDVFEGGRVLVSDGHGKLVLATERLQPAARVISDTFGCSVGQSDKAKTPIGVAGRVLVYPYQDRNNYKVGDCLCAAPNGTADIMTREEIINYPDRIIGIVDEVPTYEVWQQSLTNYKKKDNGEIDEIGEKNTTDTKVNGRIWIYVR